MEHDYFFDHLQEQPAIQRLVSAQQLEQYSHLKHFKLNTTAEHLHLYTLFNINRQLSSKWNIKFEYLPPARVKKCKDIIVKLHETRTQFDTHISCIEKRYSGTKMAYVGYSNNIEPLLAELNALVDNALTVLDITLLE